MARIHHSVMLLAVAAGLLSVPAVAQQIHVSTPLVGVHDSFYEHINIGWRLRGGGPRSSWFMGFGGPMSVIPAFGGYDPNNDFRFGFGNSNFGFNLAMSQGNRRSITMEAPSVTMMNGARGQVFSGSIRPFVTGLIPVVGDYPVVPFAPYTMYPPFAAASAPVYTSPLADRLERLRAEKLAAGKDGIGKGKDELVLGADEPEKPVAVAGGSTTSSATRGDISVAEIRRLQASEEEAKRHELESLIEEARTAEQNGHLGVARVRYQQAILRATGDQRRELQESFAKLKPQR